MIMSEFIAKRLSALRSLRGRGDANMSEAAWDAALRALPPETDGEGAVRLAICDLATRYEIGEGLWLERRGERSWCVFTGSSTINTDFERELESSPSGRDEDYLSRNRFTLEGALEHARAYMARERAGDGT